MLEILFLIRFTRAIGENLSKKGYSPGGYKFLAVASWFGAEIVGLLIGTAVNMGNGAYVMALGLAVFSAIVVWQAVAGKRNLYALETGETDAYAGRT